MRKLLPFLGVAALAAVCTAQQTVVIPNGMANSNAGTTSLIWRNTGFHFQMFYDVSHFLDQGINYPITISRLQFRASGGLTSVGGETYTGVTVEMSSSPSTWANPSTTFAANQGADNITVFTGNVVCLPAAGTSPNTYIIDIPLATPFTYDPTSGLELCIEVDAPAPNPGGVPNIAASSNASHMARRVGSGTQGATTGSASYFAAVVLMDYTAVPNAATYSKYGAGCYDLALTYYEDFQVPPAAFDLSDTAIQMIPSGPPTAPTGFQVIPSTPPSAGNWYAPTQIVQSATAATLADDDISIPYTLPFTLYFPGGSTNDVIVGSNGYVFLSGTATSAAPYYGGITGLLTLEPRLAPLWGDLDPSSGGNVYLDIDPSSNVVYITWENVPEWNVATALTTCQVAIFPSGFVEYRFQTCSISAASALTGYSPGGTSRDPGSIDISASLPFATAADVSALALEALNRPKMGTTFDMETRNIPAGAAVGAFILSFGQVSPGILLPGTGVPGCLQHVGLTATNIFVPTGTTQGFSIGIPAAPASWAGVHVYAQSAVLVPGINTLGIITSNGGDILIEVN